MILPKYKIVLSETHTHTICFIKQSLPVSEQNGCLISGEGSFGYAIHNQTHSQTATLNHLTSEKHFSKNIHLANLC